MCEICRGEGWVCESHPQLPWGEGPGMCKCDAGILCVCSDEPRVGLDVVVADDPEAALRGVLPSPAPDVQAQIEWPDWLSREHQAIVKMVKDAMTRAEDDIRNSEDASGLPRTAAGERNVYAGAIVHAFKRAGWLPPAQMQALRGQIESEVLEARKWIEAALHAEIVALKADDQARIDAAVERERGRVIGIFVGELQKLHEKTVLDCGDNSCLFATRRGGMRTNGGCRCIERLLDAAVAREREAAVYDFAAWLTTRKERLVLSSSDDAAPAAKAVQAYLRARGTKGEA